MLITCPGCGKYLSDEAQSCPVCMHVLHAPEQPKNGKKEKPKTITAETYDIDTERVILYSMMQPAVEDFRKCSSAIEKIKQHLELFREPLSDGAYTMLAEGLKKIGDKAAADKRSLDAYNAKKMREAFSNYFAVKNSSTYQGLGFSVLTDTAGAVAYSALDTYEHIKHDLKQEKAACKRFLSDVKDLSSGDNSWHFHSVFEALDTIAVLIADLFEAKQFMDEHRDFYENASDYDMGIQVEAGYGTKLSLYKVLCDCAKNDNLVARASYLSAYELFCNMGYIRVFGYYYFTTCQYERKILKALEQKKDPQVYEARLQQEKAHNRVCRENAEKALEEGKLWRAAVAYGKTIDDPDATRKSIALWSRFHDRCGLKARKTGYDYMVSDVRGDLYRILGHTLYPQYSHKDSLRHLTHIRAWEKCLDGVLYVGFDGSVEFDSNKKAPITVQKKLPQFCDVTQLVRGGDSFKEIQVLMGVCRDGSVAAIGADSLEGWDQIAGRNDIKLIDIKGDSIVALTKDGTLLGAGQMKRLMKAQSALYPDTTSFHFDVSERPSSYTIYGFNADGTVWTETSDNKTINTDLLPKNARGHKDDLCYKADGTIKVLENRDHNYVRSLESLKRIVKIDKVISGSDGITGAVYYEVYALCVDGTVIGPRNRPDMREWTDIVDIFSEYSLSEGTVCYAINSKGEILCSKHGVLESDTTLFNDIDTILDERRSVLTEILEEKTAALAQAKGLFAGKKREELSRSIALLEEQIRELDV